MSINGHFRDRHWFRVYRARMDAGLEPCRNFCGRPATTFDHLKPSARGGSNKVSNMTLLCEQCNGEKGTDMWGWLLPLCDEEDFEMRMLSGVMT